MTYNVKGLNNPKKMAKLRSYFDFVQSKLDVCFIQEHKLRERNLDSLARNLFRNALCFHIEAEEGLQHTAGKGGLAILLASKWMSSIKSIGSIFRGRAMWIIYGLFTLGQSNREAKPQTPL